MKPIVKSQRDLKIGNDLYKIFFNKERILYIKDHCEMISEYDRQIEEAKIISGCYLYLDIRKSPYTEVMR